MDETPDTTVGRRRRAMAGVGAAAIAFGVLIAAWLVVDPGDAPGASDDVCDTTEYQGCPQRWDYLINPTE